MIQNRVGRTGWHHATLKTTQSTSDHTGSTSKALIVLLLYRMYFLLRWWFRSSIRDGSFMTNAVEQFQDAIRATGLIPPDVIELGKIHRFPGIGKSRGNTSGWCILFKDGLDSCFGNRSKGSDHNSDRDVSCWPKLVPLNVLNLPHLGPVHLPGCVRDFSRANVVLFTEGMDAHDCDCVVLARLTSSFNLCRQMNGRQMRRKYGFHTKRTKRMTEIYGCVWQ